MDQVEKISVKPINNFLVFGFAVIGLGLVLGGLLTWIVLAQLDEASRWFEQFDRQERRHALTHNRNDRIREN